MIHDRIKTYPQKVQDKVFEIRAVILHVAKSIDQVDHIDECLKWGELTFVPMPIEGIKKSGTAVRLAWYPDDPDFVAFSVHCNTSLIQTYSELLGDRFQYSGKRSLKIPVDENLNKQAIELCTKLAFTYFLSP